MIMLLMFASTVIYFLERDVQPEHFGSIPGLGLVGALQTLTTVGYGDVTPVTAMGKMFGGIVMAVRGLHVRIARRNQESARHEFVVTWSMVARVPLFSTLDAAEVAC